PFLKLAKANVDFGSGILTIWSEAMIVDSNDDGLDALLASINFDDLLPLDPTITTTFQTSYAIWEKAFETKSCDQERLREEVVREYRVLKEKEDPGGKAKPKIDKVRMLDHSSAETMGRFLNVLCQVGTTTFLADFMLLDVPIDRYVPLIGKRSFMYNCGAIIGTLKGRMNTFNGNVHQQFKIVKVRNSQENNDSDNDDEEYLLKGDETGKPFNGPHQPQYLDSEDVMDHALAEQDYLDPFRNVCTHDHHAGSLSHDKRQREIKTVEEALLGRVHQPNLLWPDTIEDMLEIKVIGVVEMRKCFARMRGVMLLVSMSRYIRSCVTSFFATFELDEDVTSEELRSKKITRFILGGGTFVEFVEGGLRDDEYFGAKEYWTRISMEDQLRLSRSATNTIRSPIPRMKRKGNGTQEGSQIICGQFVTKLAKRLRLLTDDVLDTNSAPTICRTLDTTTLMELIRHDGRLIREDPAPEVSRVAMPRPSRPTLHGLSERMRRIEVRHGVIERMARRQSYHFDRYSRVFEHMAVHYGIQLDGAY
ncbi:hypothetical protein Tco_0058436, partial [Tanacetum coccineum]